MSHIDLEVGDGGGGKKAQEGGDTYIHYGPFTLYSRD